MNFLRTHIRKYRYFLLFSVLIGIGFLYFGDPPFFRDNFWENIEFLLAGGLIGFGSALFITWIYEVTVPETFAKVRIFYLAETLTTVPMFYTASYASENTGILFFTLFCLAATISGIGCIVKLWKQPGAMVFHLVGLTLWFFFQGFYYWNINLPYSGC